MRKCRIEVADVRMAEKMASDLSRGLLGVFRSPDQLIGNGLAMCAILENRVVCAASSFNVHKQTISIQINTHPEFQRQGLATWVSAAFIVHCLESGIEPLWSAAHAVSAQLAERLGYSGKDSYQVFRLPRD